MCGEWIIVGAKLETGRPVRRLVMRPVRQGPGLGWDGDDGER